MISSRSELIAGLPPVAGCRQQWQTWYADFQWLRVCRCVRDQHRSRIVASVGLAMLTTLNPHESASRQPGQPEQDCRCHCAHSTVRPRPGFDAAGFGLRLEVVAAPADGPVQLPDGPAAGANASTWISSTVGFPAKNVSIAGRILARFGTNIQPNVSCGDDLA